MGNGVWYSVANCCNHSLCSTGFNLNAVSCSYGADDCAQKVCAKDAFCCASSWDAVCVGLVQDTSVCSGDYSCDCTHDYCTTGSALKASCDPCVAAICATDSYCCSTGWDNLCVQSVASTCNVPSGSNCQ